MLRKETGMEGSQEKNKETFTEDIETLCTAVAFDAYQCTVSLHKHTHTHTLSICGGI